MDASTNEVGDQAAVNAAAELNGSLIGIGGGPQQLAAPNFQFPLLTSTPLANGLAAASLADLESLNSAINAALSQQSSYLLNFNSDPLISHVRTFPYLNAAQPPTISQQSANVRAAQIAQFNATVGAQSLPQVLDPMSLMNSYHPPSGPLSNALLMAVANQVSASNATHHHIPTPQPPGVAPNSASTAPSAAQFMLGHPTITGAAHSCSCPSQTSTAAYLTPFLQQLPHASGASTANSATLLRRKRNAQLREDSQSTGRSKCPRYDDSYRPQSGRGSGAIGLVTPPLTPRVQIPNHPATTQMMAVVASAQRQQQSSANAAITQAAMAAASGSTDVAAALLQQHHQQHQRAFCVRCQGAIVPQAPTQQTTVTQPQALSMFLQNAASSLATGSGPIFASNAPTGSSDAETSTFGSTCEHHGAGYSCTSCTPNVTADDSTASTTSNGTLQAVLAALRSTTAIDAYANQYYAEQLQQMLARQLQQPNQLMSTIPENMFVPPHSQHPTLNVQQQQQAAGMIRPSNMVIPPYTAPSQMSRNIPTALTRSGSLNPNPLVGRADHNALASARQRQNMVQNNFLNNYYANNRILVSNTPTASQTPAPAQPSQQILGSASNAPPLISTDFNFVLNHLPHANRFIMVPRQAANGSQDLPAVMFLNSNDHSALLLNNPQEVAAAVGHQMAVMHHAPEPQPVGASNDQIKRCTQIRNYVKDLDVPEQERERCTVCLMDFETGEDIRTLHCSHMFHIDCIDRWLNYNKKCPVCRVDMDKLPMLITDTETCGLAPAT